MEENAAGLPDTAASTPSSPPNSFFDRLLFLAHTRTSAGACIHRPVEPFHVASNLQVKTVMLIQPPKGCLQTLKTATQNITFVSSSSSCSHLSLSLRTHAHTQLPLSLSVCVCVCVSVCLSVSFFLFSYLLAARLFFSRA